jgi:hypothetical protein
VTSTGSTYSKEKNLSNKDRRRRYGHDARIRSYAICVRHSGNAKTGYPYQSEKREKRHNKQKGDILFLRNIFINPLSFTEDFKPNEYLYKTQMTV